MPDPKLGEQHGSASRFALAAWSPCQREGFVLATEVERWLAEVPLPDLDYKSDGLFPRAGEDPLFLVTVGSGTRVLVKARPQSDLERAGWLVAREIGAGRLLPVTIMRSVTIRGVQTPGAVCPFVPGKEGISFDRFCQSDLVDAAMFDAVIQHHERRGKNWLGIEPNDPSRPWQLLLYDSQDAWGRGILPPNAGSEIRRAFADRPIGADRIAALQRFAAPLASGELAELHAILSQRAGAVEGVVERAQAMAESGAVLAEETRRRPPLLPAGGPPSEVDWQYRYEAQQAALHAGKPHEWWSFYIEIMDHRYPGWPLPRMLAEWVAAQEAR